MTKKSIFETAIPFERFGIMLDNSRDAVMRVNGVKRMIDIMRDLGYNMLMLYTEDTYEVKGQPYFGRYRGRYSQEEMKEMDAYAKAQGIELVPCIQTLAHLFTLQHWPAYWNMADSKDILLVGEESVYQLIDDMFATLAECFTTRMVNVGMDEAKMLGLGNYLQKHGYRNRVEIFMEHLNRVSEIARKYGFEICMWSDMFFKLASGGWTEGKCGEIDGSIGEMIPNNVSLIYWDYYSTEKEHYDQWIEAHNQLKEGTKFAGGLWTWTGFAPHNGYSIRSGKAATQSCVEHQVKDVFYTVWGNDGAECSRFSVLPAMFYNACIAHGIEDEKEIKEKFEEYFHVSFDDYMLLDLPDTADAYGETVDPSKYMLYCDCFLGKFDAHVRKDDAGKYALMAKRLEPFVRGQEFSPVFATLKALCEVLAIKVDLGVRTRAAYWSENKEELKEVIRDLDVLLEKIEVFYEAFRNQWFWENKPQGFEVHDIRIGGLIRRISHCKRRITEYLDGEITVLEELDETELDFKGSGRTTLSEDEKQSFEYNSWYVTVTSGVI